MSENKSGYRTSDIESLDEEVIQAQFEKLMAKIERKNSKLGDNLTPGGDNSARSRGSRTSARRKFKEGILPEMKDGLKVQKITRKWSSNRSLNKIAKKLTID